MAPIQLRTLVRREWLQHRLAWLLVAGIPLALTLLLLAVGTVQLSVDLTEQTGPALAQILATVAGAGTPVVLFGIAVITALVLTSGLARRDHPDRSFEFWRSLPISHSASFGVPLVAHLVLWPMAALAVGFVAGQVFAALLVFRVLGLEAVLSLPWGQVLAAGLALTLRFAAGVPLALLWVAPIVLLLVLLNAWVGRWAWVVFLVGIVLASLGERILTGAQRWVTGIGSGLLEGAGRSLIGASGGDGVTVRSGEDAARMLELLPAWAAADFGAALLRLGSPLLIAGLLAAAAMWLGLLRWRRSGAPD